jgi:hypothetical protein
MAAPEVETPSGRRVFVELHELPALVIGTALGAPAACRRVLGARRAGRIGVLLALFALAFAARSWAAALLAVVLQMALSLALGLFNRGSGGHTTREVQRLAVWTAVTPLCVAALTRLAWGASDSLLYLAVAAGQLLLLRALRATR